MRRLDAYRKGGSKAISASAINTYLDCPLKFYFPSWKVSEKKRR